MILFFLSCVIFGFLFNFFECEFLLNVVIYRLGLRIKGVGVRKVLDMMFGILEYLMNIYFF